MLFVCFRACFSRVLYFTCVFYVLRFILRRGLLAVGGVCVCVCVCGVAVVVLVGGVVVVARCVGV